jgi:hypothetical protein
LTFFGEDASNRVQEFLATYDIDLVTNNVWVDEIN